AADGAGRQGLGGFPHYPGAARSLGQPLRGDLHLGPWTGRRRQGRSLKLPYRLTPVPSPAGEGWGEGVYSFRSFSICWVIRVMPLSERRKRLASRAGSSPTTRPVGMTQPLSITAFLMREWRPSSTSGRATLSSSRQKLLTRTLENSIERRTVAPETTQPPDTSESTAM